MFVVFWIGSLELEFEVEITIDGGRRNVVAGLILCTDWSFTGYCVELYGHDVNLFLNILSSNTF